MSAQGLLNSVFSCSPSSSKTLAKKKLRQTHSLDSALMRSCGASGDHQRSCWSTSSTGGFQTSPESPKPTPRVSSSSLSTSSDASSSINIHNDCKSSKRNASKDASLNISGSSSIFSPRKWLQRKLPQSEISSHSNKSEGDLTWKRTSGPNLYLQSVPIQSLSELERVRLQEVALVRLLKDFDLGCQITIPKDCHKRKKSLRKKLDSLSKEKKDKDVDPQAFGVPLSQVIFNDRRLKQLHDGPRGPSGRPSSLWHLAGWRSNNKELSSSNSSLSSASETPNDNSSPGTPETALRSQRRGGMSVDCITDLDDGHTCLLEALQLSMPVESPSEKKTSDKKLSLNPICRQVPRVLDSCCQHLEKYGLQTVGIFRVGSSKKRVRQLREEFDEGADVLLDQQHSVHDVAALLKEFLRDLPDPLLTRELYSSFISCASLNRTERHAAMQLLICLLPACNSDTLQCLLHFLSKVTDHAEDSRDSDGHEVIGNKMTSLNLATIFGPNLLHKQKMSEKEFSLQSCARVEESTAIITVVQHMIDSHQTLFMISAELQSEVLSSLSDTDGDVVNYLLRRKTPQSDHSRSSSGEISPYENNSPTRSEWMCSSIQSHSNLPIHLDVLARNITENSCIPPSHDGNGEMLDENAGVWRRRSAALLSGVHDKLLTGSDGNLYKRVSSETDCADYSNTQQSCADVRPDNNQTPRCPITSSRRTTLNQSDEAISPPVSPVFTAKQAQLPVTSQCTTVQPHHVTSCHGRQEAESDVTVATKSFPADERTAWPSDRWLIWQLLSSDNVDTLPETVV
nr:rho GTPase-activating protein 6 [Misgurnus anguillicaudatus]